MTGRDRIDYRVILVVTLITGSFAWFLGWPAWVNLRDGFTVDDWPATTGTVSVAESYQGGGQGRSTQTNYLFRYQYNVDGKQYESERYSLKYPTGDKGPGVKQTKPGDEIKVYYNPQHPQRAVIDRESRSWWNLLTLVVTALFFTLLASVTISAFRNK